MKQLLQYVFISSQDLKKFWENIQIICVLSNFNYKTPPPFNPEYLGRIETIALDPCMSMVVMVKKKEKLTMWFVV